MIDCLQALIVIRKKAKINCTVKIIKHWLGWNQSSVN